MAVETALALGLVFGLRLRQTEGLLGSVLQLMGLNLPVPDHTIAKPHGTDLEAVSRIGCDGAAVLRGPLHVLVDSTGLQIYGAGQWLEEKHGAKSRRTWCKLHMALDADNGEIIAHTLTDQDTGDASQVEPSLDQIDGQIGLFIADGAYDGDPIYNAVLRHSAEARIVIPPRSNAVERIDTEPPGHRGDHIASINKDGRMKWQASTGYGKRALIETAIGRYKGRARSFPAQQTEVAIGCAVLNRMLACARPKSVRCKAKTK